MLRVWFGDKEDVIYNTSAYFKYNYDPAWLNDPEVTNYKQSSTF